MTELVLQLGKGSRRYGRLFIPDDGIADVCVLVCNSLFGEAVNSRQFLMASCRTFSSLGFTAMYTDYTNMGEAGSDSMQASIESLTCDVGEAIAYLLSLSAFSLYVVGFRGGAIPVLRTKDPSIRAIALWEPIRKGSELARLGRVAALDSGSSRDRETEPIGSTAYDMGGWEISDQFHQELMSWQLPEAVQGHTGPSPYLVRLVNEPRHVQSPYHAWACSDHIAYVESSQFWYFGTNSTCYCASCAERTIQLLAE